MSCYRPGKEPICTGCNRNPIRDRNAKRCVQCSREPNWFLVDEPKPVSSEYEQAWHEWQRFIGQAKDRYAGPSKRPVRIGRQKILIASDFHGAFMAKEAVAAMFAKDGDADLAIFAGDTLDFYAISRFLKYEHIPIESEAAAVTLLFEQASQTFPRVIVVEGNHDKPSFEKQLLDRLPQEMVNVVRYLAGGDLSLVSAIAKRFPNIEIAKHDVPGTHPVGWFTQVNDLVVTHAEKFSRVPGSTLRGIEEWLSDFERTLDLKPWRVVVQAHTHQLGIFPWHADRMLVESGCMCQTHAYQVGAKIGGRPQRRGWIVLEQIDGRTDMNSIRMHWHDAEASNGEAA